MKLLVVLIAVLPFMGTSSGDARTDMNKLQADFFASRIEDSPESATEYEISKYNDRIESYSLSINDERKKKADGFLARIMAIRSMDLSKSDLMNYMILGNMLETYVNGYKWRMYNNLNPINFLSGIHTNPGYFVDSNPFNTRGDFENYIVRLSLYPKQLAEMKTLFNKAIELNRTSHNVSVNRVPGQIQKLQVNDVTQSVFYKPFNDSLEKSTVPQSEWDGIRNRSKPAITALLNAYADMGNYISNTYMPKTRTGYGVLNLYKGKEYYEACLRWHLSLNMTAEQVHKIGLEEVARIAGNMRKIMTKQGFTGSIREYFLSLLNNPAFNFKTADEILDLYRQDIKEKIDPTLPTQFKNLPGLPIAVKAQPTDGPTGYYTQGKADGSKPGIFWANVMRPNETGNFTAMALTLHETNPGHHLQISFALTADTPDFRQKQVFEPTYRTPFAYPSYTSFIEGWGLYAEALGEELGLYKDDYDLMGRYSYEIFRACRLVVDTGIHYYGWDKQRAVDYVLNYTSETPASTDVEIDRYITWPGQALAYKIGEIKIRELRQLAKDTLGKRYDVKEFHSVVLESGNVPLNILELNVKNWLASLKPGPTTKNPCTSGANPTYTFLGVHCFVFVLVLKELLSQMFFQ